MKTKPLQKDIIAQRRRDYFKQLEDTIKTNDMISKRLKQYDTGIIPTVVETRSAREMASDKNYTYREQRKKVYILFKNDPQMSEEFLKLLADSEILPEQFNVAYPQLKSNFEGGIAEPLEILTSARQLVQNYLETGTVSGQSVSGSVRDYNDDGTIKTFTTNAKQAVAQSNAVLNQSFLNRLNASGIPAQMKSQINLAVDSVSGSDSGRISSQASTVVAGRKDEVVDQLERLDGILKAVPKDMSEKQKLEVKRKSKAVMEQLVGTFTDPDVHPIEALGIIVDAVGTIHEHVENIHDSNEEKESKKAEKSVNFNNKRLELQEELDQIRASGIKKNIDKFEDYEVSDEAVQFDSSKCKHCSKWYFKGEKVIHNTLPRHKDNL
jgi:hypothetical protein